MLLSGLLRRINSFYVLFCLLVPAIYAQKGQVTLTGNLASWQTAAGASVNVTTNYGSTSTKLGAGSLTYSAGTVVTVGQTWNTWCCGYTGQAVWTNGPSTATLSISGLSAFGLQIEPDPYQTDSITVTLSNGQSLTQQVGGYAGAQFFGFVGAGITSMTITENAGKDFAFGNFFGVAGAPAIQISLTPAPPNDQYLITDTPTMPTVQATAQVINVSPDPTSSTTFTWTAMLTIDEKGGKGDTVDYSDDLVQNTTTTGTGTYTLTFTDPKLFEGGTLTLTATATVNGSQLSASTPTDLTIGGTNPQRTAIQNYISTQVPSHSFYGLMNPTVTDVMDRIACRESPPGQVQFKAAANGGSGPPLVAADNGIGLMQVTQSNPDFFLTKPEVVFNWQSNAVLGITTYQTKVKSALAYPASLRNDDDETDEDSYQYYINNTINPVRVAHKLMPITILPAPNFTTAGNLGSNGPNQLLEDGVRGFNGWAGSPVFNSRVLHEFIPNAALLMTIPNAQLSTLPTNANVWTRVCSESGNGVLYGPSQSDDCTAARTSSGDPVYVNNVAANPATCSSGSKGND